MTHRFAPQEVINKMEFSGLVPVFNHHDPITAEKVLINAHQAGIRVFEFTNRGSNALEVFTYLVEIASKLENLILGIGTIWSAREGREFLEAGAQFVVSPGIVEEIAKDPVFDDILWVPGCGSITEVYKATNLGAKFIKIFPGNVLGPAFAKSVKSVLPNVKIMPTGGIKPTANNLAAWFDSGVSCVGMGSQLFSKNLISSANYSQLQDEISDALSLIRSVRENI